MNTRPAVKTRHKTSAKPAGQTAQTLDECAGMINEFGRKSRELEYFKKVMNDAIADITDKHSPMIAAQEEELKALADGIQGYCEAHRDELTQGGKVKSGTFVTGAVQWRQRPPSVKVRGADSVIETLARLGLSRFIRPKEEINKEAILNEPEAVKGVAGIVIVTGLEDFVITPFENSI